MMPATLPHDSFPVSRPRHEHNSSFGGFPAIPGTSGGGSMDRDPSLDGMGFPFSGSGRDLVFILHVCMAWEVEKVGYAQ